MSDLSAIRQNIFRCMQNRDRLLHSILDNKPYIAAQVYERYKACGNEHCKCRNGELHGPFFWIYQHKKGQKLISTTVATEKLAEARRLAANYQRWQEHRQQLRELEQSIQRSLDEMEQLLERQARDYVTQRKPGRPKKPAAAI